MDYITVSAKNLDDAITEALIQLGVTSDQLDYEVIEKGSAGFLGIGMKQAVIKARKKVVVEEKKEIEEVEIPKEEPVKEYPKKEPKKKNISKDRKEKKEKKEKHDEPVKESSAAERKEVELAKIEPQTIEACEKFIYDVLNAMDMKDVKVTSTVDE